MSNTTMRAKLVVTGITPNSYDGAKQNEQITMRAVSAGSAVTVGTGATLGGTGTVGQVPRRAAVLRRLHGSGNGMSFKYNKDVAARDKMLGIDTTKDGKKFPGGTTRISGVTLTQLEKLLTEKFADPEEQQNDCPPIGEILEFIELHPDFTAHGYVTGIQRSDYRVSLEGVDLDRPPTKEEIVDFVKTFRYADELDVLDDRLHCWFD